MNIGLIAQDSKKKLMQNFCVAYRNILAKHHLFATGTTGQLIESSAGLPVHSYLGGELGGAEQFCNQIAQNDLDMVIFFRDGETDGFKRTGTYSAFDPRNIISLCDQYSIPLAENLATAELLMKSLENGDLAWREIPKE
ncbi:MAG: methylglyoxal synthase [Lachnospiraceae bacterium]|jgi:methylglyoxal synthase